MGTSRWPWVYPSEQGRYVLHSDYAALAADFSQMTAWGRGLETDKRLLAERNAALAAEVKRLRKAGDAMHAAAVQDSTGLWLTKPFEDWTRAKESR